jgi:hypothetical protein
MHGHRPDRGHVGPTTAEKVEAQLAQRLAVDPSATVIEVIGRVEASEELKRITEELFEIGVVSKLTDQQAKAGAALFYALYHHPAVPSLIMDGGALATVGLHKAWAQAQKAFLDHEE